MWPPVSYGLAVTALVLCVATAADPKEGAKAASSVEVFQNTINQHALVLVEFTHKGVQRTWASHDLSRLTVARHCSLQMTLQPKSCWSSPRELLSGSKCSWCS